MGILENLDYDRKILYLDGYFSGNYTQEIYLKKSNDDGSGRPKFYISVCSNINGNLVQQGYLYFYLDYETKTSTFIGIGVSPEYRNLNIGSFLIASWINLCFTNGYDFLGTHEKQRKPFLLYLLKTYGFEVFDKSLYNTREDVIDICRDIDLNDKRKFLLFKNNDHEKRFINTNVYKYDNYEIIHNYMGVIVLDKIIMPIQSLKWNSIKYNLIDDDLAKKKTLLVLSRHKR